MKRSNPALLTGIFLLLIVLSMHCNTANGQVSIPVGSGPYPTCLGQMYSDIL